MAPNKELAAVRREIDALDSKLLELINRRAELAIEVRGLKKKDSLGVYDPGREREIEAKITGSNPGPLSSEDILFVFREIISRCRSLQHDEKVAYLGPEGSFSNQAAFRKFGISSEFFPVPSFEGVFEEVHGKRADFGIVPVENSVEGSVGDVLDMLLEWDLSISAECFERVEHSLLSLSGEIKEVKTVASHPQALGQCRKWVAANLYGVGLLETPSTAAAAKMAARDKDVAAIASEFSGSIYNLTTIRSHIEDSPRNTTRFVVVGRENPPPSGEDKTSIAFSVKDEPGALHKTFFLPFSEADINLTKIESRPSRDGQWEYVFFADFSGHREEKAVRDALEKVEANCVFLKVLGSYPAGASG
jgi:chorismate mutase/prephenate dehydratase